VDPKIKEALQPLLERRQAQVGDETLFKSFEGTTGYQPGDTASTWLARQNLRMDVVDPAQGVPYYLLIVGPPEEIPFEFQYGLDLYWAVGRLWFPTADEFRQYAASVVEYEKMAVAPTARQIAVFAPQHDFDRATQFFCRQVATPLVNGADASPPDGTAAKICAAVVYRRSGHQKHVEHYFDRRDSQRHPHPALQRFTRDGVSSG